MVTFCQFFNDKTESFLADILPFVTSLLVLKHQQEIKTCVFTYQESCLSH